MIEIFLNNDQKTISKSDQKNWITQFRNQKLITKCFGQTKKLLAKIENFQSPNLAKLMTTKVFLIT
jgi:hypothetical protein